MANRLVQGYRYLFFGHTGRSGKYLHRFVWIGCLAVCLPILLAGTVYYNLSMDRMKNEIMDESKSSLVLLKDRAERILQNIEKESLQLAADPTIHDLFANRITDNPTVWHKELLDKITVAKNATDFISEIYFYNDIDHIVVSNTYGTMDAEAYKYKEDVQLLMKEESLSSWTYLPVSQKEGYLTFARRLPITGSSSSKGIIAFQVETEIVSKFLQADTTIMSKGQELVFVNYQDSLLTNNHTTTNVNRLANLSALQTISESDNNIDSFYNVGLDGKKAHYSYVKSVFGRTYVAIVSEEMIASRLMWIRAFTMLTVLFLIALAVVITYFSTKRAYSPIEQLIKHSKTIGAGKIQSKENEFDYIRECIDYLSKETQHLGSYMEKIQPTLRERCLQQLLNGDYIRSETLIQDCHTYGLTINSNYVVMVVEVENVYKERRFLPGDKPIVAFAVTNVMQELMGKSSNLNGYVFPYQGKGIALLQWKNDTEQLKLYHRVIEFATSVRESLKNYLSFEASIGMGRCYSHIADVPVSYKEAELALQYRIYHDSDSILHIEDLENSKTGSAFRYPRELESTLIEALTKGELEEAEQSLTGFSKALNISQSYNFIHQSYYVLVSAIITSLEKQEGSILDILEHNLFGQLESKHTSQEITDWFVEVLFPLYKKLTEDYYNNVGQSVIRQVCKYIREHCTEDISLVLCAERMGISHSYLSRLFKKEMGINFLEFVVECRVEETKRLLLETDQSISEIAVIIGYSERNLTRVFQRLTRMTPGVFRSENRNG
ncbi:helix-turn-helix domain-containing protein [Paenibacillus agricola]|uniref:AraC family transcriptional regulator n=1 Tax=Paenibacillus agricola TaxID=2716264 RepID=A0ABX0JAS4_9BACL|nr:helix-turn-helix domain-containing protein [Paenibacillus agricola]NHN33038.1 AraC family transcriptional regulator [Paenibacillus agricola]